MKSLLFSLLLAMTAAGCDSDVRSMTVSEFYRLGPEERGEFARKLGPEDMKYLFAGSAAFIGDSATLHRKTVGELIEEGKRRQGAEAK